MTTTEERSAKAQSFRQCFALKAKDYGLALTDRQLDQFTTFYDRLVTTNESMNLTAITEPEEVAVKHMIDSLSAYDDKYFPQGASLLDLGTGGGFPGVPLAIVRPDLQITLFDSLQKRLRFLEGLCQELELFHVKQLHGRAEDCAKDRAYREQFDIVTSRAVARMPVLAEWALGYVKVGGHFIALKGAAYEEECEEGKHAIELLGGKIVDVRPVILPGLEDKRAIVVIEKIKATAKKYPRKPKEIKDRPL